jgi:hypothetical protein
MSWGSCTTASTWVPPNAAQFMARFARDFNYAPASDPNNFDYVTTGDINQAISDALQNFSPSTYGIGSGLSGPVLNPNATDNATNVFFYLAAFYLVFNLQNSFKGIAAQVNFPVNSKNVGGVSISYTIPDRYAKSPILSQYMQNGYGAKFLSLALPYLVGNVGLARGTTKFN